MDQIWLGWEQQSLDQENKRKNSSITKGALTTTVVFVLCYFFENKFNHIKYAVGDPWKNIMIFFLLGEATLLLGWAFLSRKNKKINQFKRGIYLYMRNPIQLVIIFHLTVTISLFLGSWLFLFLLPLQYAVWLRLIKIEEQSLVGIYGQEYLDYMSDVPRFFPWR